VKTGEDRWYSAGDEIFRHVRLTALFDQLTDGSPFIHIVGAPLCMEFVMNGWNCSIGCILSRDTRCCLFNYSVTLCCSLSARFHKLSDSSRLLRIFLPVKRPKYLSKCEGHLKSVSERESVV